MSLTNQYGWKRSMTVLVMDEGPLKWIGVARTRISALENSSYILDIPSSRMHRPSYRHPPQSRQCDIPSTGSSLVTIHPLSSRNSAADLHMASVTPPSWALPQMMSALCMTQTLVISLITRVHTGKREQ